MEIRRICHDCNGTGQRIDGFEDPYECTTCDGSGYLFIGDLIDIADRMNDLEDKMDDVMVKCNDILSEIQNP